MQFRRLPCFHHTRKATQYPDLDSNQDLKLRRLGRRRHGRRWSTIRYTSGTRSFFSAPTTGFAISLFTRQAPFSVEPRRQARVRGFEPRAPALETGCSPRSTLVLPKDFAALGEVHSLTLQRNVPVRFTHKLRPTFDPRGVPRVQRLPCRANWRLAQIHTRLLRRPVSLPFVAVDARQHAVVPGRGSTLRPRHDVIDRQSSALPRRRAAEIPTDHSSNDPG